MKSFPLKHLDGEGAALVKWKEFYCDNEGFAYLLASQALSWKFLLYYDEGIVEFA